MCVCVCVYLYIKTVALLETWFRTLAYSSMKLSNTPIIKYTPIVYIYIYIVLLLYQTQTIISKDFGMLQKILAILHSEQAQNIAHGLATTNGDESLQQ